MALAPTATVTPCIALLSEQIDRGYLAPAFRAACPGVDLRIGSSANALGALDEIEAAVCWFRPHGLLAQLPQLWLRLVQSLAAGAEHITADARLPPHVPLCRIVDPDMALGMNAHVCAPSRRTPPPARVWPPLPGRRSGTWRRSTTAWARRERSTEVVDTETMARRKSG